VKKIPTMFERDWEGDRSRVLDRVNPVCQWVFDGEGVATRKLDGACCRIRAGVLYKRRELREGDVPPPNFETLSFDEETKKTVGWVPVGDGPEDRWFREAFYALETNVGSTEGTYELIGPKVNGNPEGARVHVLAKHGLLLAGPLDNVPRSFEGLRAWFKDRDVEGVVFHHPDGRMAKIKKRDFGMKRLDYVRA